MPWLTAVRLKKRFQDIDKRLPVGNADAALHLGDGAFDEGTHEQSVDGHDQQCQAEITDFCQAIPQSQLQSSIHQVQRHQIHHDEQCIGLTVAVIENPQ